MPQLTRRLGILAVSHPPVTRWGQRELRPSAVLAEVPGTEPGVVIDMTEGRETIYAGELALTLHSGETAHYRDNLAGKPTLWVAMRAAGVGQGVLTALTADPYEGEGLAGDVGLVVEAVGMPAAIRQWVRGFIDLHHVEHRFEKRRRRPADTDALTRGGKRILDKDETLP